jgi:uncharacterized protein (TIGR03382 family)
VNNVEYQVRVYAFSSADNRSAASEAGVGTPMLVRDFFAIYREDFGGREEGGCASGAAGLLALLGVGSALLFRRRS